MPIGPQLPPASAEKRKRDENETSLTDPESVASNYDKAEASPKRARVVGPSLPSATLEEQPTVRKDSDTDETSDEDDEYGPALPSTSKSQQVKGPPPPIPEPAVLPKRDEWMTLAASNGDWSSRIDPTKLKNRKFNTGRGAKGPSQTSGGGSDSWHETPAEKQARLQRQVLGIQDNSEKLEVKTRPTHEVDTKKLKEYTEKSRGSTLYDSHQRTNHEEEDDPSKRAFDREKDIGGGGQINASKRREMLKKASDFGSRFSSAKYL